MVLGTGMGVDRRVLRLRKFPEIGSDREFISMGHLFLAWDSVLGQMPSAGFDSFLG